MNSKNFIDPPEFISISDTISPPIFHKSTEPCMNTVLCDPNTRRYRYQMLVKDEITGKMILWTFGQKVYDQLKSLPLGKKSFTIKGK